MNNKTKTIVALVLIMAAIALPSQVSGQEKNQKKAKTETLKCWVSMDCEACQAKIEKNIPFEKGVSDLKVDLPTKIVTITYKPDKTTPVKLEKAIQKLGYKTEVIIEK